MRIAPGGCPLETGAWSTHAMNGSPYRQAAFVLVRGFDAVAPE